MERGAPLAIVGARPIAGRLWSASARVIPAHRPLVFASPIAALLALLALVAACALAGCQAPADPPMPLPRATLGATIATALALPERDASITDAALTDASITDAALTDADADASALPDPELPGAEVLASTALETSIYEEPRWGSRRIGYLRVGAVVHRASVPTTTAAKCPDGWYRVEPRGFVCVGPMASLDRAHPVALAETRRPAEDDLPYLYVLSRNPTPALYTRLPTHQEQLRYEHDLIAHLLQGTLPGPLPPPPDPIPPAFAAEAEPLRPSWRAPASILVGRARARSGFALLSTFEHDGRRFGLTTDLAVLALDRARIVAPSKLTGLDLRGVGLPVAFVRTAGAFLRRVTPEGLRPERGLEFREALPITGERRTLGGNEMLVTRDGGLVPEHQCIVVKAMRHPPAWAEEGVKWIEVSIPRQSLVAYEGLTPVYATLVSTGVGGTADPHETHATVQGVFKIYEKHLAVTMAGREASDPFDLRDVPFVQYFHEGYALHAAYWHDDFGRQHSHGCVNLAPRDAAWLFKWTDPHLPSGWHGTMAKEGTLVYVHG